MNRREFLLSLMVQVEQSAILAERERAIEVIKEWGKMLNGGTNEWLVDDVIEAITQAASDTNVTHKPPYGTPGKQFIENAENMTNINKTTTSVDIESQDVKLDPEVEKEARELSECADTMPWNISELKGVVFNACLDMAHTLQTKHNTELREAVELLEIFIDDDDCEFDHHGYCQLHNGVLETGKCVNTAAQDFIKSLTTKSEEKV